MKAFSLLAATLALPIGIASAQTPTPSSSGIPYIPLFSSGGNGAAGTSGTPASGTGGTSSAWYIDTTRNLIVMCTQAASGSTSTASTPPTFSCAAQAVPTAATSGAGASGSGASGTGSTTGSSGTPSSGAAGANPMGG